MQTLLSMDRCLTLVMEKYKLKLLDEQNSKNLTTYIACIALKTEVLWRNMLSFILLVGLQKGVIITKYNLATYSQIICTYPLTQKL